MRCDRPFLCSGLVLIQQHKHNNNVLSGNKTELLCLATFSFELGLAGRVWFNFEQHSWQEITVYSLLDTDSFSASEGRVWFDFPWRLLLEDYFLGVVCNLEQHFPYLREGYGAILSNSRHCWFAKCCSFLACIRGRVLFDFEQHFLHSRESIAQFLKSIPLRFEDYFPHSRGEYCSILTCFHRLLHKDFSTLREDFSVFEGRVLRDSRQQTIVVYFLLPFEEEYCSKTRGESIHFEKLATSLKPDS